MYIFDDLSYKERFYFCLLADGLFLFIFLLVINDNEAISDFVFMFIFLSSFMCSLLLTIYYYLKEYHMNIFNKINKSSNIDTAINQRDRVKQLEKELQLQKEKMDKLKSQAKEDIEWILNEEIK